MRDREELAALIKDFEPEVPQAARQRGQRPGAAGEPIGLIGGDLRRVLDHLPPRIHDPRMVDPFRDPASVASLLEAAAQASARVLEIGSARGFFAVDYARERPTELFVASEVRSAQLRRLIRRAQKAGVENLRALLGDVRLQLPPILEAGLRFDRIFILFPDPWWKRRHRKRRLFQPGFPAFLRSALAPAGRVILKTDVEAYRAEVIRLLETTGHLRPEIPEAPTALPASRRERELSKAGLSIFELSLHPLPEPTAQEAEPQGTP